MLNIFNNKSDMGRTYFTKKWKGPLREIAHEKMIENLSDLFEAERHGEHRHPNDAITQVDDIRPVCLFHGHLAVHPFYLKVFCKNCHLEARFFGLKSMKNNVRWQMEEHWDSGVWHEPSDICLCMVITKGNLYTSRHSAFLLLT